MVIKMELSMIVLLTDVYYWLMPLWHDTKLPFYTETWHKKDVLKTGERKRPTTMFRKKVMQKFSPNKQDDDEKVKKLSNLLKLRSEHDQAVAKTGWDSYQRDLVGIILHLY